MSQPYSNDIGDNVAEHMSGPPGGVTSLEVLPSVGVVHAQRNQFNEVFCKPKIMAVKSMTLQKIEELERESRLHGFAPDV